MLDEESDSFGEHSEADQRPILAFVDFSEGSRRALVFAADLAADLDAELHVVHVVHDPGDDPGYYQPKKKKRLKTLARLEDLAAEMMDSFIKETSPLCKEPGVLSRAKTGLPVGTPVRRMLEVAAQLEPRLVVVGSRGRTALSELLVGSKASQVVRLCPRPVAVVTE